MLQLKQLEDETEDLPPRWNIGVDRRHVVAYVAIALIAGSAGGFLAGAYLTRKDNPPALITDTRAAVRPNPGDKPAIEFRKVTRILRGDTIEVDGVGPVRMIGIETPDGKSPREIYGVHGQRAMSFVEKTLLGQEVRLESDNTPGSSGKNDDGQTLAYVYTRDGTLINGEMVKQGLAFVRTSEHQFASDFRGYERDAMQSMRGVWGSSSSSSTLATSPASSAPPVATDDKLKKLTPLPPSALGANIPALSGSPGAPGEQSVWVSPGDRMYHKSACDFLNKKKHSITLSEAKSEGYTACSRCYASTVIKAP